jgi:hypothetical protein
MKQEAETGDEKKKRFYEDALNSLSLAPKTAGRKVEIKKDAVYGLNEDSAVDYIHSDYVDKFNSFLKRRNRAKRQP